MFVTSNKKKFEEVKRWLAELDPSIQLEQTSIELAEYQTLDLHEVALGKAQEAWRLTQTPVLIDDGGINLHKYPLFPGTFSKFMVKAIGLEGIWKLAQDDPRASMKCCLVYADSGIDYHFFDGVCEGTLMDPAGRPKNPEMPYTEIFIPNGSQQQFSKLRGTEEEKKYHHRYKALKAFVEWLQKNKGAQKK